MVYRQEIAFARTLLISALAAICATFVEAYTPLGLDNISVPLTIYLIAGLMLL